MATAGWEPHRAVAAGRTLREMTQQELADRLAAITGQKWTRGMVASLEIGKKHLAATTLTAIAVTLDLPYSYFLQGVENEFRALNSANPGYVASDADATGLRADYLNPNLVHAADEKCMDCVVDPNAHVQAEDMIPGGGPIPGQVVLDLRDEALERWLQGAA